MAFEDEPTRRIPAQHAPPPAVPRTPTAGPAYGAQPPDELVWRDEVLRRLRGLRTALAVVGTLALAALALALFGLLAGDDDGADGRRAASAERVGRLDRRVDEVEERVGDRATKRALADLRSDVEALEGRVEDAGQAAEGGEEVQAAVAQLQQDVEGLGTRVDELAEQQAAAGAEDDGTTQP